jgi:hypothetical protein
MKKFLLLLLFVLLSCSQDDVEPCGAITKKGFNPTIGAYFEINGHQKAVSEATWQRHKVGDAYCL